MAAHNDLGKWGEQVAADYLAGKGWKILHRDWQYEHKDLDIVCVDLTTNTIVFVEVKTRSTREWGEPYESITLQKKNNIMNAASAYLRKFNLWGRTWRYDSISIVGAPDTGYSIEHNKNVVDLIDKSEYNHQKQYKKQRLGTWGRSVWGRGGF